MTHKECQFYTFKGLSKELKIKRDLVPDSGFMTGEDLIRILRGFLIYLDKGHPSPLPKYKKYFHKLEYNSMGYSKWMINEEGKVFIYKYLKERGIIPGTSEYIHLPYEDGYR